MTREKLFGTDGVRGVANRDPMSSEMALRLGKALARTFRGTKEIKTVLIGKDTRLSGYMFETALTSGICSMGLDVFLVGPMPTPAVAHLTKSFCANAGIMISASHNPADDNGIKIFNEKGVKLSDEKEAEVEGFYFSDLLDDDRAEPARIGKAYRLDDAHGRYVEFAKATVRYMDLSGLKLVLDCANGASYSVAPKIFRELGVDLTVIHDRPDGMNINRDCGSMYPDTIAQATRDTGADLGIALDGDADRIIAADEAGNIVDGDQILALAAIKMKEESRLARNTVVVTPMSNIGLHQLFREQGITAITAKVGDRYVVEQMIDGGFNLGGEQSGHVIFGDLNFTGDGIITGLQVMAIMKKTGDSLSKLVSVMRKAPQKLMNIKVREKPPFEEIDRVREAIASAERVLGDSGRILVRYSGTQPVARVLVEAVDGAVAVEQAELIARSVATELGIEGRSPSV